MGSIKFAAALLAASLALPVLALPVLAETQQGFPEFSARRVKPPKPGEKRITVQVPLRANPAVPPLPVAKAPVAGGALAVPAVAATPRAGGDQTRGQYAWFWDAVSPDRGASTPGRLAPALVALSQGPGGARVMAPRLQDLQDIAARHGLDLLRETVGTRVSPALALAVIAVESSGRVAAQSHAGALGLMQLMPATADRFGVTDPMDPLQNIRGGVKFLDLLMEKFAGDPILVLAGYNAGENSIGDAGVPDYAETRDYVPKVLAAFEVARGLCLTPPELISDGCVFRVSQ
ncbi:lytic transglycosylase domain-containing protein [Sagittula salina]|uniref:Lytic transglycosylase domain-containing protein n=1 Tax=Sagittula salina TaxID=2820268 RepID=A0A940MKA0_9RHOB|nr:lytic transglycosylase domain-containing protein [Sagittula salina]MBP0481335.1 lytic transglycosylase domain-containing protein [Sagittula salina]